MPNQPVIDKANAFRAMHQSGNPIVLVNVWDVASARVVAAQPVTRAIATASWSICAAMGYADGGELPLDEALLAASRIVDATILPVTVDFEKGYAASPAGVRENALRLVETGAVGLNIEDSAGADDGDLWSASEAAARVAAVRRAAEESCVPIVINARTDTLVAGGTVDDAIARGGAYLDAGADCIFVLGATRENIATLVRGVSGPVSVIGGANSLTIAEFTEAGVARISFGPGPMGVAYAALARLVRDLDSGLPNSPDLAYRP